MPHTSKNRSVNTSAKHGFTIVEMLIIAPIVILTIGAFITAIVSMTGEVLATRSSNVLAYSIQDALNRIEEDVKLSTTFLAVNNITPLSAGQGYDNNIAGFANVGTNGTMLILNTLVTVDNPLNPTSGLVYLDGKTNNCATSTPAEIMQNTPMTMNVVYFIKDYKLWRRSVMPSNYATPAVRCGTPWQQPSCNPDIALAFCKTKDVLLVDGINPGDFNIQYFNTSDATAANTTASSTGATDADRYTAMQSSTTIGASINITKTAAGRTISQSGTMRSTKVDTNASTIAAYIPDTTPTAPTVTAVSVAPDMAKFTWSTVPGASSYTVRYAINGGSDQNATTCTSGTTCTISPAATPNVDVSLCDPTANNCTVNSSVHRTDTITLKVTANNTAGSTEGETSLTIPPWNTLLMTNHWTNYSDTFASAGYTKSSAGVVMLKGLVKSTITTPVNGEVIGILPLGYRPSERLVFGTGSIDTSARIDVTASGSIVYHAGSGGWFALDGVSFVPAASPYAWTATTLTNGWVAYNAGYATPGYTKDSEGRVFTKGLIANGGTANGAAFTTLPAGYRPSEYLHFPTTSNNTIDGLSIDTSGGMLTKGITLNSYRSMQHRFYPSSGYTGTWSNLSLTSPWVVYAGYAAPQYIKGSDGIVTVKGLIRSGSAGSQVATLPEGYRPKKIILLTGLCNLAYCRLDVYPDGRILAQAGASSVWTALEGITFMAEQ